MLSLNPKLKALLNLDNYCVKHKFEHSTIRKLMIKKDKKRQLRISLDRKYIKIRGIWGATSAQKGDPNSTKIGARRDLKLQIFGAEGAEIFETMKVFKGKLALFRVLRENLAQF